MTRVPCCDPLVTWRGNAECVEAVAGLLAARDLASLARVSLAWREAVNAEHIWREVCRRTEPGSLELYGKVRPRWVGTLADLRRAAERREVQ